MMSEIYFSDCIEVLLDSYDTVIYNPVYSKEAGLYLCSDDERPIKEITLINSSLIISYLDGEQKMLDNLVMSVIVDDDRFKRRMKMGIQGTLFKYSVNDALFYDLDKNKAFDSRILEGKTRKRSL